MPTYIFKCRDCDIIWEEEHSMEDAPSGSVCPECEAECSRYYGSGSANFILKGGDWPGKTIKNKGALKGEGRIDDLIKDRKKKGLPTNVNVRRSDEYVADQREKFNRWREQTSHLDK